MYRIHLGCQTNLVISEGIKEDREPIKIKSSMNKSVMVRVVKMERKHGWEKHEGSSILRP